MIEDSMHLGSGDACMRAPQARTVPGLCSDRAQADAVDELGTSERAMILT